MKLTQHTVISYIKSTIRIAGYIAIAFAAPELLSASVLLVASEVVGIIEEIGQ